MASVAEVVARLEGDAEGQRILHALRSEPFPLSYAGDREPPSYRLLEPMASAHHRESLRFYGRALREGAQCLHGRIPEHVEELIAVIERAADAVAKILPASGAT